MRYSYEYKLECVELYRQGKWPDTPDGVSQKRFRQNIRNWARMEDYNDCDVLKHKNFNKIWLPEEKYELVAKVLAGSSCTDTALKAGISSGMLYQWVQKYKTMGYNGLVTMKKGRPGKEPQMKKTITPASLTESAREELIRLREERNQELMREITDIFHQHQGRYGVRRVHAELVNRGYKVNHKRVQRLMHNMGLIGKRPKEKYHSYQGQVGTVADNIVGRDFSTTKPIQKWTTDVSQFNGVNAIYPLSLICIQTKLLPMIYR